MTKEECRRVVLIGGKIKFIEELKRLKDKSTRANITVTLHDDTAGKKSRTEKRREIVLPDWLVEASFILFDNYRKQLSMELERYDITKEEHRSPEDFEQSGVTIEGGDEPDKEEPEEPSPEQG